MCLNWNGFGWDVSLIGGYMKKAKQLTDAQVRKALDDLYVHILSRLDEEHASKLESIIGALDELNSMENNAGWDAISGEYKIRQN